MAEKKPLYSFYMQRNYIAYKMNLSKFVVSYRTANKNMMTP